MGQWICSSVSRACRLCFSLSLSLSVLGSYVRFKMKQFDSAPWRHGQLVTAMMIWPSVGTQFLLKHQWSMLWGWGLRMKNHGRMLKGKLIISTLLSVTLIWKIQLENNFWVEHTIWKSSLLATLKCSNCWYWTFQTEVMANQTWPVVDIDRTSHLSHLTCCFNSIWRNFSLEGLFPIIQTFFYS